MRKLMIYSVWLTFLILLQASACKKDSTCYQGRVEFLNNGSGCSNILRIEKTISGGLPVNTTITLNPDSLNISVKEGDILNFTIVKYEEWNFLCNCNVYKPRNIQRKSKSVTRKIINHEKIKTTYHFSCSCLRLVWILFGVGVR
jgi:fumarate reductase subunit C